MLDKKKWWDYVHKVFFRGGRITEVDIKMFKMQNNWKKKKIICDRMVDIKKLLDSGKFLLEGKMKKEAEEEIMG